jgi:hypothetical protein
VESSETDLVLSAIRRGEDSLPKLRAATGLEYAKLHVVLHALEYEWHSIDSTETPQGFQRFTPRDGEKLSKEPDKQVGHIDPEPPSNGHKPPVKGHPAQGVTYKTLDLAEVEEVMATEETMAKGAAKLGLTSMQLYVRRQKDEAVEDAVQRGRKRYYESAPDDSDEAESEPEETCVDCGSPRSIGSGQRCRPCYLARAEAKRNGRPRIEVDLQKLEDAIADPALSMGEVADRAGIKRNLIYDRKDVDPEFRAAYDRGMERREQTLRSMISEDGVSKSDEIITKTITSNGTNPRTEMPQVERAEIVEPDKTEDKIVAKSRGIIPEKFRFPPSAMLKKLVMNDDYFPEAYDTLIGILDADMDEEEQRAVWTLLRYLKRVEKCHQEAWLAAEFETASEAHL